MEEILDIVHKTIYQFFDVCGDDEEVPLSDKDKLLLEVNKAICNNLKTLDQIKTGHWINAYPDIEPNPMLMYGICSVCGFEQSISDKLNYCPNCGKKMI